MLLKEKKKVQQNERKDKNKKVEVVKEEVVVVPKDIAEDQGKRAIRWHLNEQLRIINKEKDMNEEK